MVEMAEVLGEGITFPAPAATSGCGAPVYGPNPCPPLSPKGCPNERVGKGEAVGTEAPAQQFGAKAPSSSEAPWLGLGWIPGAGLGTFGSIFSIPSIS